jgi:hypothetical protein
MPISFGRGKQSADEVAEPASGVLNARLVKDLESASKKRFTGALEVAVRATTGTARLYFYEGGLYSVWLEGYQPPVLERLLASGAVSAERAHALRGEAGRPSTALGLLAVEHGWLPVETLATVHQEFLLASLGAVLACEKAKAHLRKDLVTGDCCTLPLPVESLLEAVRVRGQRLGATWPALSPVGTPATARLLPTGVAVPAQMALPEFTALRAAVDGDRTLDQVAAVGGFTRAEAVHLAGLLAAAGVISVDTHGPPARAADRLLVPEAFGVEPVVVPEPAAIPPVPDPVPAPERAPIAPVAMAPAVVAVAAEPESEPEPVVQRSPAPTPVAAAVAVGEARSGTEHVRQFRREVADAEVAELSEALAEAVLAEREAIAHAGAVRARLREAQASLAELDDSGTEDPPADAHT